MDFRQISEFFGGTIFPEEYRTDYQETDRRIQDLESNISVTSSLRERASVLLLRAVHSALSGEFSRADECLGQISQLPDSGFDASWPFRRNAYEFYVSCLKRVPPPLRFWTGRSNQSGVLRDYQLQIEEQRLLQIEQRKFVRNQVQNQLDKLEFNVIYDLAGFHSKVWMQAFEHHPQYPDHTLGILFTGTEPCSLDTIALAEHLGLHKTSAALKRLIAQYLVAGSSENASSALSDLKDFCAQHDDLVGEANIKLMQGDNHLSLPFTSPIALNLMPHGRSLGWRNKVWDPQESEFSLRRSELANSSYTEAYHLFEAANAKGGMGAVLLRYACLDHAEAIEAKRVGDLDLAAQLLGSARERLQKAQVLFQGDHTHSSIVSGHLLILNISSGDHTNILGQSYKLGASCKDTENIGVLHFIGMLLLRLGRKYSTSGADNTTILLCCYCAQVCFHAAKDSYLELSAVVASAKYQQTTGNFLAATRHIEHGRRLLKPVIDCISTLMERTTNQDHRQILDLMRVNCINEFNRSATSLSSSNSDTRPSLRDQSDALSGRSAVESMLLPLLVGPSLRALRDTLIDVERELLALRGVFSDALEARRGALRIHADVDMAESVLNVALAKIEAVSFPFRSSELDLMKVVILQHLGEFERARQLVPLIVPQLFGGRYSSLPQFGAFSPDLVALWSGKQNQDAERSIAMCFATKDWQLGATVLQRIEEVIPTFFDDVRRSSGPDSWFVMVWIACIHEHAGTLGSAFRWYLEAFRVVEANHSRLADINDRRDLFGTIQSGELFFGLARVALSLSESPSSDELVGDLEQWHLTAAEWLEQAVKFFELGHSRALLDLLIAEKMSDREQLQKLSEYSYQLKNDALTSAASVQADHSKESFGTDDDTRDEYLEKMETSLRSELDSITLAGLVPELKLTAETNELIYRSIPTNAIALHINISRDGIRILCITSDGIEHIHSADITDIEIERLVLRYLKLFRDVQISDLPLLSTFQNLIEPISKILIQPISKFLKDREHIIFVPSRSLNKFPFCALTLDGREIFLTKDISVCPSLASLQYITDKKVKVRGSVGVVFNDETDGVPLNISASAATAIAREFNTVPLPTSMISHDDFAQVYEESNIMLTATHGRQHPTSAWQSSLVLKPPFRVLDLSRLRSKAALVVFEACVSGLGEETVGNDMLGFSHAVLSSGASAFLGALWNVSDEASALLMVYFFRAIKQAKSGVSIARCWRTAQVQLYNADSQSATMTLQDIIKQCRKAEKLGLVSPMLSKRFRATLHIVIDSIEEDGAVYKSPFFWAPFVLVGHGGLLSSVSDAPSSTQLGISNIDTIVESEVLQAVRASITDSDCRSRLVRLSERGQRMLVIGPQNESSVGLACDKGFHLSTAFLLSHKDTEFDRIDESSSTVLETMVKNRWYDVVTLAIDDHFKWAARGSYEFLQQLALFGVEKDDMIAYLEQKVDFKPSAQNPELEFLTDFHQPQTGHRPTPDKHVRACIHQIYYNANNALEAPGIRHFASQEVNGGSTSIQAAEFGSQDMEFDAISALSSETDKNFRDTCTKLCGFGGVFPGSSNSEAQLIEGNEGKETIASIRYRGDFRDVKNALLTAANGLLQAIWLAQQEGACCDSFSIICASQGFLSDQTDCVAELVRIPNDWIVSFVEELRSADESGMYASSQDTAATQLLDLCFPRVLPSEYESSNRLGLSCQLMQLLCLGFISFLYGHSTRTQLSILNTETPTTIICGTSMNSPLIATRRSMACIGSMLEEKLFVFYRDSISQSVSSRYDADTQWLLQTNIENMLEIWGPGRCISKAGGDTESLPEVIVVHLRHGYLHLADNSRCNGFPLAHWSVSRRQRRDSEGWKLPTGSGTFVDGTQLLSGSVEIPRDILSFKTTDTLIIGALTKNTSCKIDIEKTYIEALQRFKLEDLDVSRSFFQLANVGFNANLGKFLTFTAGANYNYIPPRTKKESIISHWEKSERFGSDEWKPWSETLFTKLNEPWGVLFSVCSSFAKRVPLREVISEGLLEFAPQLLVPDDQATGHRAHKWVEILQSVRTSLKGQKPSDLGECIIVDPQTIFKDYILGLGIKTQQLIYAIIGDILLTLRNTGVTEDGDRFKIAWPRTTDDSKAYYFKCKDVKAQWMQLLQDTTQMAAFAIATDDCLVNQDPGSRPRRRACINSRRKIATLCEPLVLETTVLPSEPVNCRWEVHGKGCFLVFSEPGAKVPKKLPCRIEKVGPGETDLAILDHDDVWEWAWHHVRSRHQRVRELHTHLTLEYTVRVVVTPYGHWRKS